MRDYREILEGGSLDTEEEGGGEIRRYTLEEVEAAAKLLKIEEKKCKRLGPALDEVTTTGQGVGQYHPPLGMTRRDSEKFSSKNAMLKQFDQCIYHMSRPGMLQHCRKMGLSLGHLKDDDIRKTLKNMSVRNKRKFMGVANGNGAGMNV